MTARQSWGATGSGILPWQATGLAFILVTSFHELGIEESVVLSAFALFESGHATLRVAKLTSCSTAFLALGIGRWIRRRIWVASGLRILPDLFGICRVKLLICFRITGPI